ncbi:unnamed protein product [Hyaloperonospora brassicae]|uniref:DNA repair protein XRCC4 n=1 Tax=Hyaloperonospora brassicae TaxID=162125 RepID=A0AAV0SWW3_HYABA|nr:unnamed protein product [Hyaloperonospora brassicae]
MSLVEVAVVDIESSCLVPLFVHCHRVLSASNISSAASSNSASLRVRILDPPMLYDAEVAPCHRPRALECSDVEYIVAVESALLSPQCDASTRRFDFRWSRHEQTLTLMEKTSVAMKFCAIKFEVTSEEATWLDLLRRVATRQQEKQKAAADAESHLQQMELLMRRKEVQLDTTLIAIQKVENQFVHNFCALLNTKKDEIKRLRFELSEKCMHRANESTMTGKRRIAVSAKKSTGAKLQRKRKETEGEDDEMRSDNSSECTFADRDDNGAQAKKGLESRPKGSATKACIALPPSSRKISMHKCDGEDLLSSMNAIIDTEEEKNDGLLVREFGKEDKAMTSKMRTAHAPMQVVAKMEPTADVAMDSSEEDIHDMLL